MKNLNSKIFVGLLLVISVVVWIILLLISGMPLCFSWDAFKKLPTVLSFDLLLLGLFVKCFWKAKCFYKWLVPFPDLNGTWQGSIQTAWKNPETGEIPGPIPVILTIKQSFTHINCVMRTAEMTSRSYLADFWLNDDEQIRMLGYSYHSKPLPSVQNRSHPHDGTMIFNVIGDPVEKLKGTYWTERQTKGEVVLSFREKRQLEEFPEDLGRHPVSGK